MKILLTAVATLLSSLWVGATNVEGTVTDQSGLSVIGAAVQIKGNNTAGAVTDIDGRFTIDVEDVKEGVLVISCLGYKTKYVALKGRTILNIILEADMEALDEVVVVGYGTVRKSDLTGSVSSIETDEQESARSTSFEKMLQGKAAGVVVSTGSAAPGGSVSVRIRGTSSLRGNNSPLYVVDGNIMSDLGDTVDPMSSGQGGGNSRAEAQNPLASISPQDIQSIEVLKDASATAIYGSQGANGVILITTKSGKTGKPSVMVSANVTFSTLAKEIPMLNTAEYIAFRNAPEFIGSGTPMTMDGLTAVNWQEECTRLAVSQNYRASVSGKSNKTSYYLAAGYSDQQGVIRKTGVKKYDLRVNLEQEIGKYVSVKSNSSFSNVQTSMTSGTDKLANTRTSIVRHMISFKPYIGMSDSDDYSTYDEDITTPRAWFTDYDDDSREKVFSTTLSIDVKPLKWFTIRLKGGMTTKDKERSMWFGKMTSIGSQANGKAGISELKSNTFNTEALLLFNHTFNRKHNLNATAGVVYDNRQIRQTSMTGEDFFSEDLRADGISQAAKQYPFILKKTGEQLFSALARIVYSYDSRYILTATFRADGSSKFSTANRFSYFPSFAFAWRMHKEKWMSGYDVLSNLKIRAGWGQVGNQAISPYQTLASYNNVTGAKPDGSSEPGLAPALIPNPDLKWETSEQYNVGIDVGLWKQRFTFTVDAYLKNTKDLLQQIALPHSSGYGSMWINNGKIENKGIELAIEGAIIQKKDWHWSLGGNISFSKNTIRELGLAPTDFGMLKNVSGYWGENVGNNTYTKFPANAFIVGESIGLFMGYQTDGIMQEEEYYSIENQMNPLIINGTEIMPGDVRYVDQNGDRVIDDKDRVILGNPNPDFTFAINTSLRYRNWSIEAVFNGVYGNQIINANLIDETDVKNSNLNLRRDAFLQAWTAENRSNTYPRLGYQPTGVLTDRYIEDGSYIKLSQLSLNYLLEFKKSKSVKSLNFNFTAGNVFTLTKYSGYDPDINTFANDVDRMGIDLTSYPSARTFTFGIIANF